MPQVNGGPKGLNSILESAYAAARAQGHDKGSASAIAWTTAKEEYKKQGGKWIKKIVDDLKVLVLAKGDVKWLYVDDVLVNPYNREVDKEKVAAIRRSIEESGKVKPLVYAEVDQDGKPADMITDGHHRYLALKELGYKYIPAVVSGEDGVKTAQNEEPVDLRKEVLSVDVPGLELVRQDLGIRRGPKPYKRLPGATFKVVEKGGPGSGCQGPNCGRPEGQGKDGPTHKQGQWDRAGKALGLGYTVNTPKGEGKINGFVSNESHPQYGKVNVQIGNEKYYFNGDDLELVRTKIYPDIKPLSGGLGKGGPGSGCTGPNCGRPSSGGGKTRTEASAWREATHQIGGPSFGNKAFDEPFHSGGHVKQFLDSNNVIIASVDKGDLSPEKNAARQTQFEQRLEGAKIPYKKGRGFSSEWGAESSYIIQATNSEDADKLKSELTNKYKQDAVINVRNGHATLESNDGGVKHANTGKIEAGDQLTDNYTEVDGVRFKFNFR